MQLLIVAMVAVMWAMIFVLQPAMGAQTKPEISNLQVDAWVCQARVSVRIEGPADPVTVWFLWGQRDGGTNLLCWEECDGETLQAPIATDCIASPLIPGKSYCFRVCAVNGGGTTWSEPVWATTRPLYPIKQQVGTVVAVR